MMKYIDKKGTILIIATLVVVMLSAISATLMMQIQSDTNYTQFTRNRMVTETLLKGAIHESIKTLNFTDPHLGNIGIDTGTPWTPANDVGMDGIADTNDLGEGDGFPTFPIPGVYGPGEPGSIGQAVNIGVQVRTVGPQTKIYGQNVAGDATLQSFEAFYAVYDENLGSNGLDDNGDGKTDYTPTDGDASNDDKFESAFHRLWAVTYYGGEFRKMVVMVAATNANNPGVTISETFFKAIYAGNSGKSDPANATNPRFQNYFLDIAKDDTVEGDVYVTGNIRAKNGAVLWKADKQDSKDDLNGNGVYDFGEPFSDRPNQEDDVYNFGTEATGTIRIRAGDINSKNWKTTQPTAEGKAYDDGDNAPLVTPPDFTTVLPANGEPLPTNFIDVGAQITAAPKAFSVSANGAIAGKTTLDATNPAHIFTKVNPSEYTKLTYYSEEYYNNGLDNYILGDTVLGFDPKSTGDSPLGISDTGNNKVFVINGNLFMGSSPSHSFYFRPATGSANPNAPLRITFIVKGNVLFNDNMMYRNGTPDSNGNYQLPIGANGKDENTTDGLSVPVFGTEAWNPYDDAFAIIALKNDDATDGNSGNVAFSDTAGTLGYMDAIMYAENDFVSDYGEVTSTVTINGMMLAGNHVHLNQEFVNNEWHARPESARTNYNVNFDTRIRELLSNPNWLPGLPGGTSRNSPPATIEEDDYIFDVILSSTNS